MKKLNVFLSLSVVLVLLLSACAPEVVLQTVEVEVAKEVQTTQIVEVETTKVIEVEKGAFTNPHPILSDLKVRQAMAYCTNKAELAQAANPALSPEDAEALVMNSFIPRDHWAYAGDENLTIYPFDPEKGKALLEEAGWVMPEDGEAREKEGTWLSLKFTTTNTAYRQSWAAVWEQQMAECGIMVLRQHVPATWWFGATTGLRVRDFELGAFAWTGQADPAGLTLWTCEQIPLPENNWEGQNYMGWCNETASEATKRANNTLLKEDRKEDFIVAQQEYTKDVPALPLFNQTETFAAVAGLTGLDPKPGEQYWVYNAQEWELPGRDTIIVGFTQEPATLFTTVESALVSVLAAYLVDPVAYSSLNYDYQPVTLKQLPTIENGLAKNEDVEVNAGDKVMDVNGEIVELANGVQVRNAAGEVVEFTGEPITMKQMTSTFEFLDNLTWSDGEPVKQEDFELGHRIQCDRETGATSYILCDWNKEVVFNEHGYVSTTWPGIQDPTYFLPPFTYLPAHRQLSDGRLLKDVPAAEFATLPEIAENPIGVGPYMVKEWIKGEQIIFEANPYWYGGAPKTPNLVIKFVTAENAEAQLLTGEVDVLGSETLSSLTEQLIQGEADGLLQSIVVPSATWEHIDFNLFVK